MPGTNKTWDNKAAKFTFIFHATGENARSIGTPRSARPFRKPSHWYVRTRAVLNPRINKKEYPKGGYVFPDLDVEILWG